MIPICLLVVYVFGLGMFVEQGRQLWRNEEDRARWVTE